MNGTPAFDVGTEAASATPPSLWRSIREDVACVFERDPAARSTFEVVTTYPGVHALILYRIASRLWRRGHRYLGRFFSYVGRIWTAIDIHPGAIKSVKQRAAVAGVTNIVPIEADSPAGLETESMDVVILYDIYHDFPEPDAIIRELHRVMKPEAVLSFSDHHMKENAILSGVTRDGLFELSKKGNRTYTFRKAGQAG